MYTRFSKLGHVLLLAGFLVFLLAMGFGLQRSAEFRNGRSVSSLISTSAGAQFAIADWDGDRNPDLAFVEMENGRASRNDYSIRVHLSAGPESAIHVKAPFGGVRLAARDVNGDDNVDLVISSELDAHIIEVLLNDGHGKFSVAEPASYAAIRVEGDFFFEGPAPTPADRFSLVQTRTSFEGEEIDRHLDPCAPSDVSVIRAEHRIPSCGLYDVRPGRAPPSPALSA